MGRGKVQLKRIENKINRQVTFSKRRTGLMKKAHEISVLCDADVAVIVFSAKGKLFHYSTDSCMEKILDRYERYSFKERRLTVGSPEPPENWSLEFTKIKAKIELLQRYHRNYMGQDLDSLTIKELQNLEQQLETALSLIRSRKNQLMHESIFELHRKEKAMKEQNNVLANKIKDKEKTMAQHFQWEQPNLASNSSSFPLPQPLPFLSIGGSYQGEAPEMMRNELELTLEPLYSCKFGCFTA